MIGFWSASSFCVVPLDLEITFNNDFGTESYVTEIF